MIIEAKMTKMMQEMKDSYEGDQGVLQYEESIKRKDNIKNLNCVCL